MEDREMSNFEQTIISADGSTVRVGVKKPTNQEMKDADIYRAKAWNKAFKEGVMTKAEVDQVMKDRGIWNEEKAEEEKNLTIEVLELERKLYIGEGKKKPKLSEGRKLAIQMKEKRILLRELISDRISMDENTAESIADNARFDYLVYVCSFNVDTQERLFESYEDYNQKGTNAESIAAAQILANMVYNLDSDFEDKLPENQFLKKFDLLDDNNQLVDPNTGDLVDIEGNEINELGHYIDKDGKRVDLDGNKIDGDGLYEMVDYENDLLDKKPVKKRAPRKKTAKKTTTKAKQEVETTAETSE
jgi:hypothetical protein